MFSIKAFSHWNGAVATAFARLSKPQTKLLALFSAGVALARSCTLARVAEALPWLGKADSIERRLQRFLAGKINWKVGCQCLAQWVLSQVIHKGLIVLLVDETTVGEHLKAMVVGLAYHGRAIPLAWWCYHQDHYPLAQTKLIGTLLDWIAPAVRPGWKVLVQMDRGLSNSPTLLRHIEARGWYYLVRVRRDLQLRDTQKAAAVPFSDLITCAGQHWSNWVYVFKGAGFIRAWAIGYWGKGHKDSWLLLTNYPPAQAPWYGWRMWEELAFRDLKSNGWQWHKSRVWNPEHANRLWLVMALAYAWVLSLGTQGARQKEVRSELARGKTRRHSLFTLGLRLLRRAQELFGKIFRAFDLFFLYLDPREENTG
jgi:hypothetical protein